MKMWPGRPYPLGATPDARGVNFALYSEHADRVDLVLVDDGKGGKAGTSATVTLPERTGPVWHGYLPEVLAGRLYGYRVHGPYDPQAGHRFNPRKLLLDPYARAIGRPLHWDDSLFGYVVGEAAEDLSFNEMDSASHAPLGTVTSGVFDWGGDRSPVIPWDETIIYETHVRGISKLHHDVPPEVRGTYLGLSSDPILRHLRTLGVTTLELMPVQAFITDRPIVERGLSNYWGYHPLNFFAPEPWYAAGGPAGAVDEFKTMVRTLHAAGFEVIIDVVYNHTGEGNHFGPTVSFRGIDNRSYYKLTEAGRYYMDYTGTGNTLDPGNAYVLKLITDSLRYWVEEMHIDGFRFDLASALAREFFDVNMLSPFFKVIQQDPVLSRVKLIAEPWDVGEGGYQVGNFPWLWAEWNGRYRDVVRRFWRGDRDVTGEFVTRLAGSSDLYELSGRRPYASINFVTAHDGFTLQDLVSYEHKHNEANGEGNRDGTDENLSLNCGVEGPSEDPAVLACREVRKRALAATLLLSQGVPMLLGGDELSRSQGGNNNAYCQDNAVSWYDWKLDDRRRAFLTFVQRLVAFRREHPSFHRRRFLSADPAPDGRRDVLWLHPDGREMTREDWEDPRRSLGMLLDGRMLRDTDARGAPRVDDTFLVLIAAGGETHFVLPPPPQGGAWLPVLSVREEKEVSAAPIPSGSAVPLSPPALMVLRAVPS